MDKKTPWVIKPADLDYNPRLNGTSLGFVMPEKALKTSLSIFAENLKVLMGLFCFFAGNSHSEAYCGASGLRRPLRSFWR